MRTLTTTVLFLFTFNLAAQDGAISLKANFTSKIYTVPNGYSIDLHTDEDNRSWDQIYRILMLNSDGIVSKKGEIMVGGIRQIIHNEDENSLTIVLSPINQLFAEDACEYKAKVILGTIVVSCNMTGESCPNEGSCTETQDGYCDCGGSNQEITEVTYQ